MLKNFIILLLCVASLQLLPVQPNAQKAYDTEIVSYQKFNQGLVVIED